MARNLIKAGHQLIVHDMDEAKTALHREMGAEWAATPEEVARRAPIMLTSLPEPADEPSRGVRGESADAKRVEEVFGRLKTVGGGRKLRYCAVARNGLWAEMALAAYNLVRIAKLMPPPSSPGRSLRVEDEMPNRRRQRPDQGPSRAPLTPNRRPTEPRCRHRPAPDFPNSHSSSAC